MNDEATGLVHESQSVKESQALKQFPEALRLVYFFDGDRKRLVVDRFFDEWDELRDLLPPELGQVGISLHTGELTLHGGAKRRMIELLAQHRWTSVMENGAA